MPRLDFYQTSESSLEKVLLGLLTKTIQTSERAVVVMESVERINVLSSQLWTQQPDSWLPHGVIGEDEPSSHPIWLTNKIENPNNSNFLFLTDANMPDTLGEFNRCFNVFDGNVPELKTNITEHWSKFATDEYDFNYYEEKAAGKWVKTKYPV